MGWRAWSPTNPCPACGGHRWTSASADQCRGGYNPDVSESRIWCSVRDSGKPNSTGTTFEWEFEDTYPWLKQPRRKPGTAVRQARGVLILALEDDVDTLRRRVHSALEAWAQAFSQARRWANRPK
jgi:hypothetical protein